MSPFEKPHLAIEMTALSTNLLNPLDDDTKRQIQLGLWGQNSVDHGLSPTNTDLSGFWAFYRRKCIFYGGKDLADISIRTHNELLSFVESLRAGDHRSCIRTKYRSAVPNVDEVKQDALLNQSIDLAATILTMMEVGNHTYDDRGSVIVPRKEDEALGPVIAEMLIPKTAYSHERLTLEKSFHILNLKRIGGLQVEWTSNFLDHLQLKDDDRKLQIFHHISFLKCQLYNPASFIPQEYLDETINTLDLLFSINDDRITKWYKKQTVENNLDPALASHGYLNADQRRFENFDIYRNRLIVLKQRYDQSRPQKWKQFWYDRRDGPQFFQIATGFIVGILTFLTIIFGIIQIVESGYQIKLSNVQIAQGVPKATPRPR